MNWKIYSFQLPLTTGGTRDGLLIRLTLSDGEERWGEVAPLLGRSKETLSEALQQLLELFETGKTSKQLFASVQFGIESALTPTIAASAPLYAFLIGTPEEVLQKAETAFTLGYKTVKIKASSFSIETTRDIINTLKDRFRLRVDCNNAFSYDQAISLFSPFDKTLFDYIEDPTYELDRLFEFPFPFALDEHIEKFPVLLLPTYRNLYGFILKPTLLGGAKGCAPWIEYAQKNNLKVVFSPTFESGLGLFQILALAQKFNLVSDPLGLDTYRYLKQDLLQPGINFCTPHLTVGLRPQINHDLITEIAHGNNQLPTF